KGGEPAAAGGHRNRPAGVAPGLAGPPASGAGGSSRAALSAGRRGALWRPYRAGEPAYQRAARVSPAVSGWARRFSPVTPGAAGGSCLRPAPRTLGARRPSVTAPVLLVFLVLLAVMVVAFVATVVVVAGVAHVVA